MRLEVKKLIVTTINVGSGTENDPHRLVTQYWDMNGNLLFEDDPQQEDYKDMYYDLIYMVEEKVEGETRHETALRLLREAQAPSDCVVEDRPLCVGDWFTNEYIGDAIDSSTAGK